MFLGQLLKRLVISCVDSDALNWTITKNRFYFKHYKINFVALDRRDSVNISLDKINPSFFPSFVHTCFGPSMLSGHESFVSGYSPIVLSRCILVSDDSR
jgi:hypothetical protein